MVIVDSSNILHTSPYIITMKNECGDCFKITEIIYIRIIRDNSNIKERGLALEHLYFSTLISTCHLKPYRIC